MAAALQAVVCTNVAKFSSSFDVTASNDSSSTNPRAFFSSSLSRSGPFQSSLSSPSLEFFRGLPSSRKLTPSSIGRDAFRRKVASARAATATKEVLIVNTDSGGHAAIGFYFAKELAATGSGVTVLTVGEESSDKNKKPPFSRFSELTDIGVKTVWGNPADIGATVGSTKFDVVLDNSGKDLEAVKPVADWAKENGTKQFLFISSAGIYNVTDEPPHVEGDAVKKTAGHHVVEEYLKSLGFDSWASFRPQYMTGSGNNKDCEEWFFDRIVRERPVLIPEPGIQLTNIAHISDVSSLLSLAVEKPEVANGQIFNAVSDRAVTLAGFARLAAKAVGKDVEIVLYNPKDVNVDAKKAFPFRITHFYAEPRASKDLLGFVSKTDLPNILKERYEEYVKIGRDKKDLSSKFELDDKILEALKHHVTVEKPDIGSKVAAKMDDLVDELQKLSSRGESKVLSSFDKFKQGFSKFKKEIYEANPELIEKLKTGQWPEMMVVACADSRVCPTAVLGLKPGDAFIVRNIANMVPAWEKDGNPSMAAALEYAVLYLKVKHIIVMGHRACGGVGALVKMTPDDGNYTTSFIERWVEIGKPARAAVNKKSPGAPVEVLCETCEKESVNNSLSNLLTYPFVVDAVTEGKVSIHGGYYDHIAGTYEKWDFEEIKPVSKPVLTALHKLEKGFAKFKKEIYEANPNLMNKLKTGQWPEFMVVACADSRVCPTTVLGLKPGDAFIVRNIANMVPAWESEGKPSIAAALEYAVLYLKVKHIVVIGHRACGGVGALVKMTPEDGNYTTTFIERWVQIGKPARSAVHQKLPGANVEELCKTCEKESVVNSLNNLLTYPFVVDAVGEGKVSLHGGYYDHIEGSFQQWDFGLDKVVREPVLISA